MVRLTSFFSSLAALSLATLASAASLQQVSNFGSNPSGIQMYIYVPANVKSNPAVIVASHPCGGSAQEYFGATKFPSYADSMGFILIYPSTTKDYSCWDVYSSASLTRNGGGDSEGIVQMVDYVIKTYNADPTKVFATGSSSGAMMTSVLACVYPDVFNAGACFSGVPCACFKGSPAADPYMSDQNCARDQMGYSASQWTSLALAPYPSYTGKRTRMQIWHGTADTLVYYGNLRDQLEQWSGVFGISFSHNVTNTPASGYTEMVYGDGTQLVGYSAAGVGHFVPTFEQPVLSFFGITAGGSSSTGPTGPTSTATSTATSTVSTSGPAPTGGSIPKYGQCGGMGWTGSGSCASGSTCNVINPYYSQCL